MKSKRSGAPPAAALRQLAERRLRAQQRRAERPPDGDDARALLHELQVHQIELEMQNENLQRAQIEAQQGADKYAELFDFAPVGYFVLDTGGMVREANLAGAALLGLDRRRVTGRPFEQHLAPDSRAGFREFLRRAQAGEGQRSCEVRLLGPGPGLCDALLEVASAADEAGPARDCLLAVTDVTERKRAEAAARENEQLLREVIDLVPHHIFAKDREGRFLFVNRAAAEAFGRPAEEMVGRLERELRTDTSPAEQFQRDDRDVIDRGEPKFIAEEAITYPDHRVHFLQTSKIPFTPPDTRQRAVLGVAVDVTDRKRAEDALRQSEERLQAALAAAHAIAWEVELASGVLLESGPVAEFFGQPEGFRHGTDAAFFESVHPEDRAEVRTQVARTIRSVSSQHTVEFRLLLPDGAVRWVASSGRIERDAAGRPVRLRGISRDITARKQAEAALARTHRALRVLAEGNHALVRATSEQELLKAACRIAVELGGYRMAWVGYAEHDARKSVRPVAQCGVARDYVPLARLTWADTRRGCGPAGVAIRTGRPCACRDVSTDPRFAPWRRKALKRGYASALALPLLPEPDCMGVLAVYAAQPDAFDDSEVQVLQQLANDLSFGIMALRGRAGRAELERQVIEICEREQRRIGQDLHDGLGQSLTGIHYLIGAVQQALAGKSGPEAAEVKRIGAMVGNAVQQVRELALDLFPEELRRGGIAPALQELAAHTQNVFGISCRFRGLTEEELTDINVARQAYRIVQEAVNNAVKHSKGKAIEIRLSRRQGRLVLTVRDTGRGMPRRASRAAGMGQRIMKYRADTIGALLKIESARGKGTTVTCVFPPEPSRTRR